jgi:predicted metal-dependent hydrolase
MPYPYRSVEAALAELFRAKTDHQRRTFRARINHLQRLAVIELAPGKGRTAQYELEHIWRWLFCLELAEIGVAPATASALVQSYWKRALAKIFRDAQRAIETGKEDVFLWLCGSTLMSSAWNPASDRFAGVPHIGSIGASDFKGVLKFLKDGVSPLKLKDGLPPRVCVVNLTARLRVLNASLATAQQRNG